MVNLKVLMCIQEYVSHLPLGVAISPICLWWASGRHANASMRIDPYTMPTPEIDEEIMIDDGQRADRVLGRP